MIIPTSEQIARCLTHLTGLSRLPPAIGEDLGAESLRLLSLVALEDRHQVADVGRRQPQGLDLGQLGIHGHVRDAIPEIGEGVVYALSTSPFFFIRGVPSLRPDRHVAALADTLMKMLLESTNADDLLADLATRKLVLASMTRLMVVVVMVQVVVMRRRLLLTLRIRQDVLLTGRGMRVLLQGRVTRLLNANLLDQGWRRRCRTACSRTTPRDAGIRASPIRRLAVDVGNRTEGSCTEIGLGRFSRSMNAFIYFLRQLRLAMKTHFDNILESSY